MQPSRLIPQTISRIADRGSTLLLSAFPSTFITRLSQIRETKNRATNLLREDHCTPDPIRMKCVWKNLLRHLKFRSLPEAAPEFIFLVFVYWSWRRDLNPRPPDYKSGALPTELRQHNGGQVSADTSIPLIPSRCPGQLDKLSQRGNFAQPGAFYPNSPSPASILKNHSDSQSHRNTNKQPAENTDIQNW